MTEADKIAVYETEFENIISVISSELTEISQKKDCTDFDQGMQLAYKMALDTIRAHLSVIHEVTASDEDT